MSDNSTAPMEVTLYDVQMLTGLCLALSGNADQRWLDVPSKAILGALTNYYLETPTPDPAEIMQMTGWSEDSYAVLDTYTLNETIPLYNDLLQYIPQPMSSNQLTPIFATFTALSTLVLALRLWSRLSIAGRLQAFDWCTVLAYVLIVAWGVLGVLQVNISPYEFSCDLTYNEYKAYERLYGILMFTYPIAILSIKAALLLFYHQLSAWKPLRIGVYFTAFICFGNAMAGVFAWVFQCNYPNLWDHAADFTLSCALEQKPIALSTGVIGIITDVIIWLTPMPLVFQLQLSKRERTLAVFTFGIGLIACVGSICRIIAVNRYIYYGDEAVDGNDSRQPIVYWGIIEMNLALICSSVPALRALIIKHVPKILSKASDGSGDSKGSSNYKGHGKPSLISEEDGPNSAAELSDFRSTSRTSDTEKNLSNVNTWSAVDGYHAEHVERR